VSLAEELEEQVAEVLRNPWTSREGMSVPKPEDIGLANDAVILDATVLYADLSASTDLVDSYPADFAAEVYKTYLLCAARIIRAQSGIITAYDGDRIMAVFIGKTKNTNAAKVALKINWACTRIINPAIANHYPNANYDMKHVVGIDTSSLMVARTGIRGSNELVWVGRAANYAAKLSALSNDYPSRMTAAVFKRVNEEAKTSPEGQSMWEHATWNPMNGMSIYRSTWAWEP
jgi:class 3 adenylate cyclase